MRAVNVAVVAALGFGGCAAPGLRPIDPETDFAVVREFDVAAEHVWSAWTEPALVRQWWGPGPFSCPLARMDVRVGGCSLVAMDAPAEFGGGRSFVTWTYTRIVPNERLEFVARFSDAQGRAMSAAEFGLPAGFPDEIHQVVSLRPLAGGRTELRVAEYGYRTGAALEQSRQGLELCLDKMQRLLASR